MGIEVATHTDINDKGQTVKIKNIGHITTSMKNNTKSGKNVKTGDAAPIGALLLLSTCSVAVVVGLRGKKKRKTSMKGKEDSAMGLLLLIIYIGISSLLSKIRIHRTGEVNE